MTDVTVSLSDESYARLREVAEALQLRPEDLLRASLVDLIEAPGEGVGAAVEYVLQKNARLYERLA